MTDATERIHTAARDLAARSSMRTNRPPRACRQELGNSKPTGWQPTSSSGATDLVSASLWQAHTRQLTRDAAQLARTWQRKCGDSASFQLTPHALSAEPESAIGRFRRRARCPISWQTFVLTTPECACPAPPERTETRFTNELLPVLVPHSCIALHSLFPEIGQGAPAEAGAPCGAMESCPPLPQRYNLLDSFTMQREVQTVALDFLGHAQADGRGR